MRRVGPNWIRGRHRLISSTADPAPKPSDFTCQPSPAAASLIPSGAGFKRMFQWPPSPAPKNWSIPPNESLLHEHGDTPSRSRLQTASESHHAGHLLRISSAAFSFPASREPNSPPGPLLRALCPCVKKRRTGTGPSRARTHSQAAVPHVRCLPLAVQHTSRSCAAGLILLPADPVPARNRCDSRTRHHAAGDAGTDSRGGPDRLPVFPDPPEPR
jgi:hypothetical protein